MNRKTIAKLLAPYSAVLRYFNIGNGGGYCESCGAWPGRECTHLCSYYQVGQIEEVEHEHDHGDYSDVQ